MITSLASIARFETDIVDAAANKIASDSNWMYLYSVYGDMRYNFTDKQFAATYGSPVVCLLLTQKIPYAHTPDSYEMRYGAISQRGVVASLCQYYDLALTFVSELTTSYSYFNAGYQSPNNDDDALEGRAFGKRLAAIIRGAYLNRW
jgi:hypothetical protein